MNEDALTAELDEANVLIAALRRRTVLLNAEIRLRDQKIHQLEQERNSDEEPS